MAVSSNSAKAKCFKAQLNQLGCPYTEGVEDSWITELIFKPGEARIRLLQWLLTKFDSSLNEILDPQHASVESKMDSRIQRLLYVASVLGLCKYDDVDLIRGVTSAGKQAAFMEMLLDLVCIADAAEDPQNKALQHPGLVTDAMPLDEQLHHDVAYLNNLCNQGNIETVFSTKFNLLPHDIQKQVEDSWASQGHSKESPPRPDLQAIADSALKLAEDMERQREVLEELKKLYHYQPRDESKMENVSKTLSLVMSELSQLVTSFTYCYENGMGHWCNKTAPTLTQLGPVFKRVHRLVQTFSELLKGFKDIRDAYTRLNKDSSAAPNTTENEKTSKLVGSADDTLASLQDMMEVLEETIQHTDASSLNTTSHSARSWSSSLKNGI